MKPKTPKGTPVPSTEIPTKEVLTSSANGEASQKKISIADVVCPHGKLDPEKANDMKVITNVCV